MVHGTTEVLALIIAAITAVGLIWRKVVVPVRNWFRRFKAWMVRVDEGLSLVEEQMKPNSGKTLMDKVEAARIATEQAREERAELRADIADLRSDVRMLLDHDQERDVIGKRYGDAQEETE